MNEEQASRIDYGIVLSVMLLAIIGLGSLHSTVVMQDLPFRMTIMQGIWYVLGISAASLIMLFDSEQLWKITEYLYIAGIVIMFLTLFLYDRQLEAQWGGRSWVRIPFINFTLQPSEFVKISYILMLAKITTLHNSTYIHRTTESDWRLLLRLIGYAVPIVALNLLQGDLGTTLVYFAILGGVILISGIQWKILLPIILLVFGLAALAVVLVVYNRDILKVYFGMKDYQFSRIDTWLDPYHDASAASYQLIQSLKAIGSGGVFGKGFAISEVFVPVRESDMIFATIGENFGFAGGSFLIFVYFVLIYNMIKVVYDTKNEFYAYIAVGVIMMIVFHVVENIGMNIGLLPVTGIPLPFISQGGSALLGNMMGIGLIMSMRFHYRSYMFSGDGDKFH
ncbi:FtsW/RodA/SpoVE family cell cycle protein [Allofustis seminis]|uniref:FtsW/RodA/SpoVE family cell cycle protein n=1 Tax=Allofustis seminis TaxID=166939 RepID=UPI00036E4F54|nr:FtsW/RodA/SpoVE family cell cycle protein [Allofustis seminis]